MGRLLRRFVPAFTEERYRRQGKWLGLLRGKHVSFRTQYEQVWIGRLDGSRLRICVYTPRKRGKLVPGLLWLHGGGYATGAPEQDGAFITRFIRVSGCVVAAPDYTLSVEKPYPAALEDAYTALLWLKDNGGRYGMRQDQIFIGGESAGGGLTAALCLYARDRGEVAVAFQMPLYPMLDDRPTHSNTGNQAPLWTSESNDVAWKMYLGDAYRTDTVSPYAAPARCDDFRGLPPACSYVGGIEPFRDETIVYMKSLKAAGIPVQFRVFPGCFHAFDVACPWTKDAREAPKFLNECFKNAVKHYFARQPHPPEVGFSPIDWNKTAN